MSRKVFVYAALKFFRNQCYFMTSNQTRGSCWSC